MVRWAFTISIVVLATWGTSLCESPKGLVVVPVECGSGAKDVDAQVFYQGIIQALSHCDGIHFQERSLLNTLLAEQDLTLAIGPEQANKNYSEGMAQFEFLLIPSICRLGSDYMLSIRVVSVEQGLTVNCEVSKTRLSSELANVAGDLVKRVLPAKTTPPEPTEHTTAAPSKAVEPTDDSPAKLSAQDELRRQCVTAKAQDQFPGLWQRVEGMRGQSAPQAQLVSYYYRLIQLSAQAQTPPEGMAFVPGGWVSWQGLNQNRPRKLWVEPFFIDRTEVSVEEYSRLLSSGIDPAITMPITADMKDFNDMALPVTGVSFNAAQAFARATGNQLPTALQRLRADDYFKASGRGDLKAIKNDSAVNRFDGNVREWTHTWQARNLFKHCRAGSPREPENGTMKLIYGRSWRMPASANLLTIARPGEGFDDVGFRCSRAFFFQ